MGRLRGVAAAVRPPAVAQAWRARGRSGARRHGLFRHPRLRRSAQTGSADADRYLRRHHLERDHAAVGTVDRARLPDHRLPRLYRWPLAQPPTDFRIRRPLLTHPRSTKEPSRHGKGDYNKEKEKHLKLKK